MTGREAEDRAERAGPPGHRLPLPAGQPFGFLAGVKVLDLTTSIAGPYAAMLLGDFGADVVKIERKQGDDARGWGPPFLDGESLWFLAVNRNKRSVALDYADGPGAAALRELIAQADVVLVNQPPRVARKLGIGPDQVKVLREDVVYVSITGFGLDGTRADWTCYDLIAEGYSGVMDVTGSPDGAAQKVGAPAADMLAGHDAAMAAIAALFGRMQTGKGAVIGVSLVESMTRFLSCRIVPYLGSGEVPSRSGGTDSVIAVYQAFDTADLPITLGLGSDNLWRRFWEALGEPERASAAGTASNADRRARRAEIVADIQERLLRKPRAHWLDLFQAARIPAGPINRVDEVAADEELIARGMFFRLEEPGRIVPQVGTGFTVDGAPNRPRRMPPLLGAHTDEVLAEWLGRKPDASRPAAPGPIPNGRASIPPL
ncbi:CaiB/BaiF CoA transferase family protein [uncultured Enterovirga sp.]|uniref:CaiB/BaiF CoA transferase family protein n=1 Tax=uncultured Enterovirga sp. TaxID=2026352 RepID=UPI0035CB4EED